MKNIVAALLLGSVMLFVACNDDGEDPVDTTAPTIEVEEPHYGESFAVEGEIHFEALFTDDVQLATYNIDIHDNFDGHTHSRVERTTFDFDQSFDLSGLTMDVHEDIEVASDALAGPYHFIITAIDAAGNSTTFADGSTVELEVWITNEEMAHIHFTDEAGMEVDEFDGAVDTPLMFFGEVEDEVGTLDHVEIKVGHMEEGGDHDHDHDHGRVLDEEIYEGEFEVEGKTSVLIQDLLKDVDITVAQSDLDELEEGEHLYLIVKAEDEDGNIAQSAIEIHFD